ncbi:hypothetical protein GH714_018037 [Hevea brasiliensis]|uniref:RING-type domain-containing protein n=1 Tax=Hevea brasiliensis TaxID=3981 RepID=A0A6A6LKT6_HEVBR|nr:hypothetical protein GH714_018037 [Hevea brasiliensis]
MWFQSHSTCPLCRNSVAPLPECSSFDSDDLQENIQSPEEILASGYSTDSPNFPTNVLFWGDQTQVSTGGGGGGGGLEEGTSSQEPSSSYSSSSARQDEMMVIDIPVQMSDNFPDEESKSPMPTQRLRSLKRLLSREKRVAPSSSSDIALSLSRQHWLGLVGVAEIGLFSTSSLRFGASFGGKDNLSARFAQCFLIFDTENSEMMKSDVAGKLWFGSRGLGTNV